MYRGFVDGGSEALAHIVGIGKKSFSFENYKTHETTEYKYSETQNNGNNTPLADESRFGEVTGVRFALKPLVENLSKIITLPSSSIRTSISISDKLNQYNTGAKLKALIPSTTIEEFMNNSSITQKSIAANYSITGDKVIPDGKGKVGIAVGRHTESGLNVGISVAEAEITVEGKIIPYNVTVRFVAEPNGNAVVAIGNLDGNEDNLRSTIIIRTNNDASEIQARTFGKANIDDVATRDTYTYENGTNKTSDITGNSTQFSYTHTDGGTRVTKYDGTVVSTK